MTPKRKAALQWFHDRGEVSANKARQEGPGPKMIRQMLESGQLEERKMGIFASLFSLTDKGRRDLHEGENS